MSRKAKNEVFIPSEQLESSNDHMVAKLAKRIKDSRRFQAEIDEKQQDLVALFRTEYGKNGETVEPISRRLTDYFQLTTQAGYVASLHSLFFGGEFKGEPYDGFELTKSEFIDVLDYRLELGLNEAEVGLREIARAVIATGDESTIANPIF